MTLRIASKAFSNTEEPGFRNLGGFSALPGLPGLLLLPQPRRTRLVSKPRFLYTFFDAFFTVNGNQEHEMVPLINHSAAVQTKDVSVQVRIHISIGSSGALIN